MLKNKFPNKIVFNSCQNSIPSILSFSIKNIDWEELFNRLPQIAVSNGSACNSKTKNPSHVLMAMGLDKHTALSTIRLSMGLFSTDEEMAFTLDYLETQLSQLI